jgi:hypothetical protein
MKLLPWAEQRAQLPMCPMCLLCQWTSPHHVLRPWTHLTGSTGLLPWRSRVRTISWPPAQWICYTCLLAHTRPDSTRQSLELYLFSAAIRWTTQTETCTHTSTQYDVCLAGPSFPQAVAVFKSILPEARTLDDRRTNSSDNRILVNSVLMGS